MKKDRANFFSLSSIRDYISRGNLEDRVCADVMCILSFICWLEFVVLFVGWLFIMDDELMEIALLFPCAGLVLAVCMALAWGTTGFPD